MCWDTKKKYFCNRKKYIYVPGIIIKAHIYMQTLNTVVQNVLTNLKKHYMTNPGDV